MSKTWRAILVGVLCTAAVAAAYVFGPVGRELRGRLPILRSPDRPLVPVTTANRRDDGPDRPDDPAFGRRPPRHVLSPHETTGVTLVDGAELSIEYGRPSMRERVIFGALVPYDDIWCPGADECTKLTTSRGLHFAGLDLQPGAYTLWMRPTKDQWTLTFNGDAQAFHTHRNPSDDIGTIPLVKQGLDQPVEQLTFAIRKNPSAPGGAIVMSWEATEVSAPFTVSP